VSRLTLEKQSLFRTRVNSDQDRQCTYNVTVWRFRLSVVTVETRQCVLCVSLRFVTQQLKMVKSPVQ